jgi:hypothetical protein
VRRSVHFACAWGRLTRAEESRCPTGAVCPGPTPDLEAFERESDVATRHPDRGMDVNGWANRATWRVSERSSFANSAPANMPGRSRMRLARPPPAADSVRQGIDVIVRAWRGSRAIRRYVPGQHAGYQRPPAVPPIRLLVHRPASRAAAVRGSASNGAAPHVMSGSECARAQRDRSACVPARVATDPGGCAQRPSA